MLSAEALSAGKLLAALIEAGLQADLLAGEPYGPVDESPFWADLFPSPRRLPTSANKVRRLRLPGLSSGAADPWPRELEREATSRLAAGEASRPDFLLVRCPPADTLLVACKLARETPIPIVACISDILDAADLSSHLKSFRKELPRLPLLIFPCQRLLDYYVKDLRIDVSRNATVIPHVGWGGSLAQTGTEASGPLRLLHIGALGSPGRIEAATHFLEAFRRVSDVRVGRYPKTHLILVGDEDPAILEGVSLYRLEEVVSVRPLVAYEDSLSLLVQADALVLLEGEFEEGVFLPSKFCDYAASGKPVLMYSPEVGTISDIVGGSAHPGFMRQTVEGAAGVLTRFLDLCAGGRDLSAYRVPPDSFLPERVAASFLDAVRKVL
jgi:glycosyltransferase involved in cell wall biosynthesis